MIIVVVVLRVTIEMARLAYMSKSMALMMMMLLLVVIMMYVGGDNYDSSGGGGSNFKDVN